MMTKDKSPPAPVMRSALAPGCCQWMPLLPPATVAEPVLAAQIKDSNRGQGVDAPSVGENQ